MSSSLLCKGIQMNGEVEEGLHSGTPRLQSSRDIVGKKKIKHEGGKKSWSHISQHNTNSEWVHMHSIVATLTRFKSYSDI